MSRMAEFLCQLPEGYDERSELAACFLDGVIVVHPELPPLHVLKDGTIKKIDLAAAESDLKKFLEDERSDDQSTSETKPVRSLL